MLLRFVQFFKYISTLSYCVQKLCNDEMKQFGLKGSHVQYVAAMDRFREGITAVKLGQVCERDKAAVSRALSEMEKKGLVTRVETGGVYRHRLILTEKGEQVAESIKKRAVYAVHYAGKDLTEENRAVFYDALRSISENLLILCDKKDGEEQTEESVPPQ